MKLLTEEEALNLKVGDRVNVYWFQARKPFEEKFVDLVWKDQEVAKKPYKACHEEDGVMVALTRGMCVCNGLRMELTKKSGRQN